MIVATVLASTYLFAAAIETWRCDRELMARWPAIVFMLAQASFFIARIPFADRLPFPPGLATEQLVVGAVVRVRVSAQSFLSRVPGASAWPRRRLELEHRRTASVDPLTGVANRRAFLEAGERLLQRTLAEGRPAAVLVLDLDLFKTINDTFGHHTGDRVLCAFCDTAADTLRPNDLFGRMGGEEFACLLPGASAANALQVAERIRANFEGRRVNVGSQVSTSTVSIGIAMAEDVGTDLETVLRRCRSRALSGQGEGPQPRRTGASVAAARAGTSDASGTRCGLASRASVTMT